MVVDDGVTLLSNYYYSIVCDSIDIAPHIPSFDLPTLLWRNADRILIFTFPYHCGVLVTIISVGPLVLLFYSLERSRHKFWLLLLSFVFIYCYRWYSHIHLLLLLCIVVIVKVMPYSLPIPDHIPLCHWWHWPLVVVVDYLPHLHCPIDIYIYHIYIPIVVCPLLHIDYIPWPLLCIYSPDPRSELHLFPCIPLTLSFDPHCPICYLFIAPRPLKQIYGDTLHCSLFR